MPPSNDVPKQLFLLLVELLRSRELLDLAITGAWFQMEYCLFGRLELGHVAMELGLFELGMEYLHGLGGPANAVSISLGKGGQAGAVVIAIAEVLKTFAGERSRPDIEACLSSGAFDMCVDMVVAFASAGVNGLQDANHMVVAHALLLLSKCASHPRCEAKIRGVATALTFCLEHTLDVLEEAGITSGSYAARVCCAVFGRDEKSELVFTPLHIDLLIKDWSPLVRAAGYRVNSKPSADSIFAAQLCVSDANKPMLIANRKFIPYLVDALLLDPGHPRADMKAELKVWCQLHHIEALAQLAVHDASREALLRDGSVVPALQEVAETGLSEDARELAAAALTALSDKELEMVSEGQKHVMLSYQWDHQAILTKLNQCLIARGYATWFDVTNMKGSTMDAMSGAIEGADVMLYGVSRAYKESANVRGQAVLCFMWHISNMCSCVYVRTHSADWRRTTPISKSWT
eukprot:COSAG02_NODE_3525_length_6615_cov_2.025629_8_plen_462_part_00